MERNELPTYMIPIEGEWAKISNKWLIELEAKDKKLYHWFDWYIAQYQKCPIGFVLPHGPTHPIHGNMGKAILNDHEHDLILVTAPNQVGKSYIGASYTILRAIPCDPNWICFKEHGIEVPEWKGPQAVLIGSYSWDLMNSIWNTYRQLLPRHELGDYSPNWGAFAGEAGRARNIRFHNIGKEIVLNCGTKLIFKCYRQSLSQWESLQADLVHLDEQCDEDRYDAVSQRQLTRGEFTPIITTLTGHVIPDRPDTGAAGWIKQKIVDRGETKGRNVGQYKLDIETCPDAIMSKKQKQKLYIQWVEEPKKNRDFKKIEEAKARYYGDWQHGAGLVFDTFSEDIHIIKEFNVHKYLPTYYRMIDHGTKPLACGLFAVMPWGDVVMFDELYEDVPSIEHGVKRILEISGADRRQISESYWEEVPGVIEFASSECDARSFGTKSPESGKTIGQIYNENGCLCFPASGQHDDLTIPMAQELFALKKDRTHIDVTMKRREKNELDKLGVPMLYITENCYNVVAELRKYIGEDKDDHLISVLKFFAGRDRPYLGDGYMDNRVKNYYEGSAQVEHGSSAYTGY